MEGNRLDDFKVGDRVRNSKDDPLHRSMVSQGFDWGTVVEVTAHCVDVQYDNRDRPYLHARFEVDLLVVLSRKPRWARLKSWLNAPGWPIAEEDEGDLGDELLG